MRANLPVTGREISVSDHANILSTTNLNGDITYANADFIAISGFSEEELRGQPHNIVRHPDMPSQAFADLWSCLHGGQSWMGLVKNRCKNGDHYWVSAFVTPVSRDGRAVEYQSVRTRAQPEQIRAAEAYYRQLRDKPGAAFLSKLQLGMRARVGLLAALGVVLGGTLGALFGGVPLIAAAPGILLGSLGAAALGSLALAPLRRLARQARQVGHNPVSQRIYTGRRDEIGEIAFAMKMLEAEAGAMVGRIADSSDLLSNHARALLAAMQSSTQSASRQQQETDKVATAINQMAATSRRSP